MACNGEQAAYNTTDSLNGLHLHRYVHCVSLLSFSNISTRSGPAHLVTREARFKIHTVGTPWPVAAPKTSTVSKITNGIKKIFSKDVEAKSEDAATLEARDPRFKVHTVGTPWPVAAPKTSTVSKITNGIKKIFSRDVALSVEARSPRFKVHTVGTPWPVAAPKTSTISKITNGIKKIFSKDLSSTLESRRFKVHTVGTPRPVAAPKVGTVTKIANGIKKIFSKSVATEESTEESTIEEAPVQESEVKLAEDQDASEDEESVAEQDESSVEAEIAEDEEVAN